MIKILHFEWDINERTFHGSAMSGENLHSYILYSIMFSCNPNISVACWQQLQIDSTHSTSADQDQPAHLNLAV
jgi:hypothetical protein